MLLLEPKNIANLELKNRIVMAPMNLGGLNNSDGSLSERAIEYFTERARGGVGLIITGTVRVTREFERSKDTIPLWMAFADHKIHTSWINELSERCHDYGTKVAIQLTLGGGRQAGSFAQEHGLAIGPSEIPCFYPPHKNTRALTKDDINKFINAFHFASSIIKIAGANAIQLHGHEGYLMDQFTSSLWNKRTDEYGGSLANRLRFIKEIINAIKTAAGHDFPIIYRYGISHFIPGGRTVDEAIEMAQLLESYGVAALDIDAGCYDSWYFAHPPSTLPPAFHAGLVEKVKAAVKIPVIISGKINYPDVAENILENKQADFISLGRPLIADPFWVRKVEENKAEEIRPCIGCHEGCLKRVMEFKSLSCAVNPAAGNERYLDITKSEFSKKIIVIGGGVAGMVAASVAAQRGHSVMLLERENQLGGNFQIKYLPYFKSDYKKYILFLSDQMNKLKIEVRLNTAFTQEIYNEYLPDVIIVAIGAQFKEMKIPGIETVDKLSVFESFEPTSNRNVNIAVIGGGLVGTEAAINLAQNGANVYLFEKESAVAKEAFKANRDHLLVLLKENNVNVLLNVKITKFTKNRIFYTQSDGAESCLDIQKIIVCSGMEPRKIDMHFIKNPHFKIVTIGDALKPRKVIDAVWEAYRLVRLI